MNPLADPATVRTSSLDSVLSDDFLIRAVQLLDDIEAPMLYVVGTVTTISLLILLQVILGNIELWQAIPKNVSRRLLRATQLTVSYWLIVLVGLIILTIVIALGDAYPNCLVEPTVYLFYIVLGVPTLAFIGLQFWRLHELDRVPLIAKVYVSVFEVVLLGIITLLSWASYAVFVIIFNHKGPLLALFVLVVPVSLLSSLMTIIWHLLRSLGNNPQQPIADG